MLRVLSLLSGLVLLCGSGHPAWPASREPVRAAHGMVASSDRFAAQAGVAMLRRGGNAVDAAVTVAFVLAVTYPLAGNLGGGGFIMIHRHNGQTTAIDYRETAPAAATRTMYLDAGGEPLPGQGSSTLGYSAIGVPGTVAGLALAHQKYGSGKLSWAQLIEPARRFAIRGFPVSRYLANSLHENRVRLAAFTNSHRIFLRNGQTFKEGEILKQPELAATLARLQKYGPREFYSGQTARLITADMARHHGLITLNDLKEYTPKERVPLRGSYRGYGIVSMPPPSSGGAVLIEMLNMLEAYDLSKLNPLSSRRYHLLSEVMRRGFADRAEYFGDPDFVSVPWIELTSKDYAAGRRSTLDVSHASKTTDIGPGHLSLSESTETTHFTIVDAAGNAVTNTYTLNGAYGSGVTVAGTGVLLNNEMDDFAIKPGTPNQFGLVQNERNAIEPRKRPLSSMTPTFVLRPDGKLWFAFGTPGGPTIINTVLQVISNVIDHRMTIQQAIDAPRIHHQWLPDEVVYEPDGFLPIR